MMVDGKGGKDSSGEWHSLDRGAERISLEDAVEFGFSPRDILKFISTDKSDHPILSHFGPMNSSGHSLKKFQNYA